MPDIGWLDSRHDAAASPGRLVALAWERTLPSAAFAADRSFEEAGGDSALLMQFFFHLEELCGRQLPMEGFELSMRPGDFVAYLAAGLGETDAAPAPVVPLFLLPGRGADEPRLARFRQACETAVAMRTLAYPDWPRMVERGFSFETLAEELAATIAAEAAEGPVRLVGYSFGGHLALAVAHRLAARGRTVAFVAILDANALQRENFEGPQGTRVGLGARVVRFARSAAGGDGGAYCGKVLADVLARARLAPLLRWVRGRDFWAAPRSLRYHVLNHLRMDLRVRLLREWHVGAAAAAARIAAPVFLFRSEEASADAPDDLGWRRFCDDLTIVRVPGSHLGIFDAANLDVLVRRFLETVPRGAG